MADLPSGPVGGTLFVTIEGRQYDLTGSFTFRVGGPKREPVEGLSGRAAGFTEVIKNAGFKADFVTVAGLSETAMRGVKNAEAQLELANGRKVVYDSLFCMDCDDTDPVKGTMSAEFGHLGAAREA